MGQILRVTKRRARKTHNCNACYWLFTDFDGTEEDYTPEEWASIKKAIELNSQILPGEEYEEVAYEDCGEVSTYRQKPDIDAICTK